MSEVDYSLESQEFYNAVIFDLTESLQVFFYSFQFIFYTSYQDLFPIVLYHSPELVLAISDFISVYLDPSVLSYVVSHGYHFFDDSVMTSIVKLVNVVSLLCL